MISVTASFKSPGGCKAWLEKRPVWEIEELINDTKHREHRDMAFSSKACYEAGLEQKEIVSCLCWEESPKVKRRSLEPDFYKEVLGLAENLINEKNEEAAVGFWVKYGPLISSQERLITIPKLKHVLAFLKMLTDLWYACANRRLDIVRYYLEDPDTTVDARGNNISEMISNFLIEMGAKSEAEGKKRYLYLVDGKLFLFHNAASYYGTDYYLELPAKIFELMLSSGENEDKIYQILQNILTKNINKKISASRLIDLKLSTEGSYITLKAPTLYDVALFTFFSSTKQAKTCRCGCGQAARPGSAYAEETHRLDYSRKGNSQGVIKNRCLSFYRRKLNNGVITSNDYAVIKDYVDGLVNKGKDITAKNVNQFCKKRGFPLWEPKDKV